MKTINELTLDEKLGQLLMVGFHATNLDDHIIEAIKKHKIGNVILFARNIKSAKQLFELNKKLQQLAKEELDVPLFISVDQEGGMVTRIFNDATFYPGNMTVGATNNSNYTYQIGQKMGQELRTLGINMNLAPDLDVNNNLKNPVIGVRSYSDDPFKVATFGSNFIEGLQEEGVIATGKHFPGHGDTSVDSHLDLTTVKHDKERLHDVELVPFKKAISSGIKAIMSAHVTFPAYEPDQLPATLSKRVLTGLLREELGYEGLIVTDCMQMKAIDTYYGTEKASVMAIEAGANMLCISHSLEKQVGSLEQLKQAVKDGRLNERYIDQLVGTILAYKKETLEQVDRLTQSNYIDIKDQIIVEEHKKFAQRVTDEAVTQYKGTPFKESGRVLFIGTEPFATTIADDQVKNKSVIDEINEQFPHWQIEKMSVRPDENEIKTLSEKAKNYDQVVITSYNANIFESQAKLVQEISEQHEEVHVIATRNPYDVLFFNVKHYVCLYEYTPNSINSLVKYLKGELNIKGQMPVNL
ncbi:beta-N-acetylhexosaminidase [Haloplasma contractile]|uniref:Beta-glucosidase-related glycosidase Carbohydrate transport protein n=1 Tax=Haloplasma contractile SSD-17B TaxID=1033810 RepID=F7PU75_9MOLU|nr:beta-N-acetylhexosaminidase [Haloplasma contractile]ERJ11744.1 Beta-glucosidase-related glycosidase Carbohydrate transport protein [Haloplasma contractile SSD-17B]